MGTGSIGSLSPLRENTLIPHGYIESVESRTLKLSPRYPRSVPLVSPYIAEESLLGLLLQGVDFAAATRDTSHWLWQRNPYLSTEKLKAGIVEVLARFEFIVTKSNSLAMSPQQLFSDIGKPEKFESSISYKYYQAVASENSLEDWIFLRGYLLKLPDFH